MTMHVCRCQPGEWWWQRTTGFMTMHAVTCMLTGISSGHLHSITIIIIKVPLPLSEGHLGYYERKM